MSCVDWEDVPRWEHINEAGKTERPKPPETSSSSADVFEDLNVPAGTKGVWRASTAVPMAAGANDRGGNSRGGSSGGRGGNSRGGSGRGGSSSGSGEKKASTEQPRAPRPASDRQRTRTRRATDS